MPESANFNPNPNSALHNCSRHEVKYAMDEQRKDCKVCTWFALLGAAKPNLNLAAIQKPSFAATRYRLNSCITCEH